jgi:Pretoxin HINT domain
MFRRLTLVPLVWLFAVGVALTLPAFSHNGDGTLGAVLRPVPTILLVSDGHQYDDLTNTRTDQHGCIAITVAANGAAERPRRAQWEDTLARVEPVATDASAGALDEGGGSAVENALACATNSFTAGTVVVMADGSTKAISQVRVGDKVEATDPATGKTVAATVSHLFLNDDHNLADVYVRQADGTSAALHATQGHRFWDQTLGAWVLTTQLRAGDMLRSDDGSSVVVEAVHSWSGSEWMYDLTVDGTHTFYTLAGSTAVLVHNCGGRDLAAALGSDTRTFTRFLQSIESAAAESGGATRSADEMQALWDEAMSRGFTAPRGAETEWVGGPHINIYGPGGGPNIHFPLPPDWLPDGFDGA